MLYKSLAAGVIAFGLPTFASATLIFTTSMGANATDPGWLSTIKYVDGKLELISKHLSICGVNPSWLEFAGDHIYCLDEDWSSAAVGAAGGALNTLKTTRDGTKLTSVGQPLKTLPGPVSSVRFGQSLKGLAIASYGGNGTQSYDISSPDAPKVVQELTIDNFTPKKGADPQQLQPRPHHVVLDPTGDFIVAPDLGSDLLRIFKVDKNTLKYVEAKTVPTPDLSGPRHGAFAKVGSETYFYVITERSNEIIGWKVTYNSDGLDFGRELFIIPSHGPGSAALPATARGAELVISPDSKFLLVSSRFENSLAIPNPEDKASGQVQSDPIINYAIQADGTLKLQQIYAAGGINPRHFSISKDGSLVVTALQKDGRVALIKRDVQTGNLTEIAGAVHVGGDTTFAKFKE
ncbi:Lactonase, 7-bladed beta-propeller-domain-containing protein [Copromyces sp. CBS 386.78]|nr:Lactonase, 7-bladed beta-propeller-domain-containing protein [Copromyces sp. CBS 386.78]